MQKKDVKWDIYRAGLIADISISVWPASTQLNPEDIGIDDLTSEEKEVFNLGRKRLIKKKIVDPILKSERDSRNFLRENSFEFPFGTSRFVPFALMQKIVDYMGEAKERFNHSVETFLEEYDSARSEMISEYEEIFQKILESKNGISKDELKVKKQHLLKKLEARYPSKDELRRRFGFDFSLFEIQMPNFSVDQITMSDALDKQKLNQEMEAKWKEVVSKKIDIFLEDVMGKLRGMVIEMTDNFLKRIKGDQGITMKTVKAFKRFAEEFKGFDFVDWDIQKKIEELRIKLDQIDDKKALEEKEFLDQLEMKVIEIHDEAKGVEISKVLGQFKRMIRFEEEVQA